MLKITNQAKFQKQLKKLIELVPEVQVQVIKKVSFDVFKDLQETTPEDTVRAKGGWNTVVDGIPSEWKPAKVKGKTYKGQKFKGQSKIREGSVVHISNNVEYIKPLDEGHSTQAPHGIMDVVESRALIELKSIVKQLSKKVIK